MAGIGGSYGPNPGQSGGDPRGRGQNQSQYQQQRFEQQQGPVANLAAYNYGRGSETGFADYNDIMNQYGNQVAGGGGVTAGSVNYTDPYNSYGGYQEFSKTGGYSPDDIANMRSRGTSPVRAAYANAEREVGRQRSLQGGYSPNATATLAKMAREQSQSGADAMQNVEAGLAQAKNQGRLAGLGGMRNIEDQRLGAQLDAGKFNAQQQYLASMGNSQNQLDALRGMSSLYGATPGMAGTFGNQAIDAVNSGGNFGNTLYGHDIQNQTNPGAYEQTADRIGKASDIYNSVSRNVGPIMDWYGNRKKQPPTTTGGANQPQEDWYQD